MGASWGRGPVQCSRLAAGFATKQALSVDAIQELSGGRGRPAVSVCLRNVMAGRWVPSSAPSGQQRRWSC
jgi:hypothetical protein